MSKIFECQTCKKQSDDFETICDCEAKHLGLTILEIEHYKELQKEVEMKTKLVNKQVDKETLTEEELNTIQNSRKELSKAVKDLIEFEEIHQINIP